MGTGPVYLSLDIDVADPAFAPGTGTPEVRTAAAAAQNGTSVYRGRPVEPSL